ncbi:hypothetical protein K7X08_029391 [Anisodus acutangulus]|uniref:Glutathione peroxidase n=1 Tax=Anisodus acutangulus TaxID=402998 RepID=A0A9Q1L2M0_9SOLA|nr:hypothetical protein K7X08_029391 [Anisodus acutangulus]
MAICVSKKKGNYQNVAFRNYMVKSDDEELVMAYNDVEDQLQVHRSWVATRKNHTTCDGRGIYVYDLPTKFNKDLVVQCADMIPWVNLCKYFMSNNAMGEPLQNIGNGWYQTHQYSLELIFHSRILNHPCRVHNPDEAKLFYVPFYGGLDILRWHFKNISHDFKDSLGIDLVRWLESQKHWFQKSGNDHVFVLGKISWDFRRVSNTKWGSRFLELDEMQNPVKLLIERQPWHVNDIGIPHPTYFHPQSDDDIIAWQDRIIKSNRKSLVSFAGAARPGAPANIRSILINHCTSAKDQECTFLDCNSGKCDQPELIIELFMESEFCLQPPGDSPTRKSVFDSLISGCIPVIFDPFTAYYQYSWHLPEDHKKYSVFIDQEDVRNMKVNVVERLMQIPAKERENMRRSDHTMASQSNKPQSVYDFTVKDAKGNDVDLSIYKGKALIIVNVASQCGLTNSNYTDMTELYRKYKDQGLEILAFPCNQFGGQEPGSIEDIQQMVCTRFKAEYPIFDKVDVNGDNAAPLYKFLKSSKGGFFGDGIKWNFSKFLVDKEGHVVDRYSPTTAPASMEKDIKKLLGVA